jgi:hypothetical protein
MFCPKSLALQDAVLHSTARRMDEYGDDGIYLDGTGENVPCTNTAHGCGYRAEDGSLQPTYPVFGNHKLLQRLYVMVKSRKPDGVLDVHCSFDPNYGATLYADIIWTGEHWHHFRNTGAEHIASELTLDMFRAEFMGYQLGVAADTLAYRLGPYSKVAAISLLHDIPVRINSTNLDQHGTDARGDMPYSAAIVKLWKVRDQFGAKEAKKLFYWHNQDYVTVSPDQCYATLLQHPTHGVLALVSNLHRETQTVRVRFDLSRLGLPGHDLAVFDALTDQSMEMSSDGEISVSLDSHHWMYVWLKPSGSR